MPISQRDQEDFDFLWRTAVEARSLRLGRFLHLDRPVGIWNYIRIANDIAARVPPGRLLDWGCGFGQMTYLLRRRGFDVVPFEIGSTADDLPGLPLTRGLGIVRTQHPTQLPFRDASFDAVLSCGVLEHVDESSGAGSEMVSLAEIHRVLRPRGYFPIYQLPQRYTWQEAVTRTFGLGYAHPRRYTAREIRALLAQTGYAVERVRRHNMLPKNLTGVPEPVRAVYSRFSHQVIALDGILSRVPLLNQVAGVLEVLARRAG